MYRPILGLAVLVLAYPIDVAIDAGPVRTALYAVLIATLLLVWIHRQLTNRAGPWQATALNLPVVVFAGTTLVSLAGQGGQIQQQIVGLLQALAAFVVFFLVIQSLRSPGDLWLLLGAVLVAGLLQATATDLQLVLGRPIGESSIVLTFDERATTFASYLVLIAPFLIALGLAFRRRWPSVCAGLALVILSVALFATQSRAGWFALITATLAIALLLPGRRLRLAGLAIAVISVLLVVGLGTPILARLGPQALLMIEWRRDIWIATLAMMREHAIFGVGVGDFHNFYPFYSLHLASYDQSQNLFLNIAAERGILGLIAFWAMLAVLVKTLAKAVAAAGTTLNRAVPAGLIASFTAFLVHAQFEAPYGDFSVELLFWLLVGVAASLPYLIQSQSPTSGLGNSPSNSIASRTTPVSA